MKKSRTLMIATMIINIIGLVAAIVTYLIGGFVSIVDSLASNTVNPIDSFVYNMHTIVVFTIGVAMLVISIIAMVRLKSRKSKALILTDVIMSGVTIALYVVGILVFSGATSNMLAIVESPLLGNAILCLILTLIALI